MSSRESWNGRETSALIDAWAPLLLCRSNRTHDRHLTAEDWGLVAAAVNAHRAARHRRRCTAAQCKERVEALLSHHQPPSSLRRFSRRLRAVLDGLPPGFDAAATEQDEEDEGEEEVCLGGVSGGSAGTSWPTAVLRVPGKGLSTAAAVVTKLADVYERVEMAALEVQRKRIKMEMERNRKASSCSCD